MNMDVVQAVEALLIGAGYERLGERFFVGTVEFDSVAALIGGPGSLELVLLIPLEDPTLASTSEARWLAERVARALDAANSRRPLTAVLITEGEVPSRLVDDLLRVARVIFVNGRAEAESQLAPLLPWLALASSSESAEATEGLTDFVRGNVDASQFRSLIRDAAVDAQKVEDRFGAWLEQSFQVREDDR